jgi:hypothetical protein
MPGRLTKIDEAWEQLFKRYDILARVETEGTFRISSAMINKFHEARLMAKFDQSANLPEIFRSHNLSILPVTRGDYLIGPFDTHASVEYKDDNLRQVRIPQLETLDARNLFSESAVIFFAYNSGIIEDITGSRDIRFTVNGRMSSGNFSFSINDKRPTSDPIKIEVENSQVEIDAGFESPDGFFLCEVKNQASKELLIRQLYYPYRLWSGKISKPVFPMFLAFSNDIFHVFKYKFADKEKYNSITLVDYRRYTFADEDILLQDIIELWRSTKVISEPDVSFPQADFFPRVLDLLSILHKEDLTRSEVTLGFEFDPRQTNYYVSACEYLGMVERYSIKGNERGYRLTEQARSLMSMSFKEKHLALIRKVLERPVFYKAFDLFVQKKEMPDKDAVCAIIKSAEFPIPIHDTTIDRRSSTVLGWLNWMVRIAE